MPEQLSWSSLVAGSAMIPVVVLALWALSHPVAGALALVTLAGVALSARRAAGLVRCFRECGGVSFQLAGTVRVTIARSDPCTPLPDRPNAVVRSCR